MWGCLSPQRTRTYCLPQDLRLTDENDQRSTRVAWASDGPRSVWIGCTKKQQASHRSLWTRGAPIIRWIKGSRIKDRSLSQFSFKHILGLSDILSCSSSSCQPFSMMGSPVNTKRGCDRHQLLLSPTSLSKQWIRFAQGSSTEHEGLSCKTNTHKMDDPSECDPARLGYLPMTAYDCLFLPPELAEKRCATKRVAPVLSTCRPPWRHPPGRPTWDVPTRRGANTTWSVHDVGTTGKQKEKQPGHEIETI